MIKDTKTTAIDILGTSYQMKCPESEVQALQNAAKYVEEQMLLVRNTSKALTVDRMAVIAALNIAHQFLNIENTNLNQMQSAHQRIRDIQSKVEHALAQQVQMELHPAE